LQRLLAEKREAILRRWLDLILDSYPADTRGFLRSPKNQFTNPVGHTITEAIASLYEQLLQGDRLEEAAEAMERLIRVRAVQDMAPSEAVGFIPALKNVLRQEMGQLPGEDLQALQELEQRIDGLTLQAFDLYSLCKERLYQIRVDEIRMRTERLLKMANLVVEWPEQEGDGMAGETPGA